VLSGQSTANLDTIAHEPLRLDGGTISDGVNSLNLDTFPTAGAAKSLGVTSAIAVNYTAPPSPKPDVQPGADAGSGSSCGGGSGIAAVMAMSLAFLRRRPRRP